MRLVTRSTNKFFISTDINVRPVCSQPGSKMNLKKDAKYNLEATEKAGAPYGPISAPPLARSESSLLAAHPRRRADRAHLSQPPRNPRRWVSRGDQAQGALDPLAARGRAESSDRNAEGCDLHLRPFSKIGSYGMYISVQRPVLWPVCSTLTPD